MENNIAPWRQKSRMMGQLIERVYNSLYQLKPKIIVSGSLLDGTNLVHRPGDLMDIDLMGVLHELSREEQKTYLRFAVRAPGYVRINVKDAPKDSLLRAPRHTVIRGGDPYYSRLKVLRICKTRTKIYLGALARAMPNVECSTDEKSAAFAVRYQGIDLPQPEKYKPLEVYNTKNSSPEQASSEKTETVDTKALKDLFEEEGNHNYKAPFNSRWPDITPREVNMPKADTVFVLSCCGWPAVAKWWPTRKRTWPPKDIVEEIVNGGFHLVPKASPGGNQHMEWRISFSAAENVIMSKVTNTQFTAFCMCKEIMKNSLDFDEILSTYHLKTMFMWCLEKKTLGIWLETRLRECVFGLLEIILHTVGVGVLPHYFIPSVNLLSHIPNEVLVTLGTKLVTVLNTLCMEQISIDTELLTHSVNISPSLEYAIIYLSKVKRQADLMQSYVTAHSNETPDFVEDADFLYSSTLANIAEILCDDALLICHAQESGKLSEAQVSRMEKVLSIGHFACQQILESKILGHTKPSKTPRRAGNTDEHVDTQKPANKIEALLYVASCVHADMEIIDIHNHIEKFTCELVKFKFSRDACSRVDIGLQKLMSKYSIEHYPLLSICQLAKTHFWNTYISWKPPGSTMTTTEEGSCWDAELREAISVIFANRDSDLLLTFIKTGKHSSAYVTLPLMIHYLFPDQFSKLIPSTPLLGRITL